MKRKKFRRLWRVAVASTLGLGVQANVAAQGWPERPIRMIVPFAPGGNVDITARAISGGMSTGLGRPVVVENRPGASGMIAADLVAKAVPDGHTLLIASTGVMTNLPALKPPQMTYDVERDFAPIVRVAIVPLVLVVHPSVPVKTTREFIALARTQAGRILIASSGAGTDLFAQQFMLLTGSRLTTVPYKGSGPALVDLMAGHVDSYLDQLSSSLAFIRSGRVRAIAVTTEKRARQLADVPTLAESGVPGFAASTVTGLFAPAATPTAVIARVNKLVTDLLATDEVKARFETFATEAAPSSSEAFGEFIRSDIARWRKVVQASGLTYR